jgi:hypothetical protein
MASKMRMGNPSGLTSLLKDGYKHMSGELTLAFALLKFWAMGEEERGRKAPERGERKANR